MKVAVMQPYIFPYIGYFQMIHSVDVFVFYDDVNYIKKGWINRNRILINGKDQLITVPLINASQNKLIREVKVFEEGAAYKKVFTTIKQNYKKAKYFSEVFPLIERIFCTTHDTVADLAIHSIEEVNNYVGIDTVLKRSSVEYAGTKGLEREKRLIEICRQTGAEDYINAIGGQDLYSKDDFGSKGINLQFIKPELIEYKQFNNNFVPWLSIIDVLMFNSIEEIQNMLNCYELI